MSHIRHTVTLAAALIISLSGWAQMRFSFTGIESTTTELSDGCTVVQLPEGTDFSNLGTKMSVTVGGKQVPFNDINPNPSTTFITQGEIETFVYNDRAYSFRFTDREYSESKSYLFAYFNGNSPSQEQICFALSEDGFNYTPLNGGSPILNSADISLKGGVRDPHILRGDDGYFYMVVTDMRSEQGWASNDGLVLLRSSNLTDWKHTAIDFPTEWPDRFDRESLTQVWAPQTIYDEEAKKYMVYYTIGESGTHYKIYYSYANDNFTQLTEPKVLYDHGANTIDADIVWHDGKYHMFFKTEGNGNGIQKATSPTLHGEWTPGNKYLQQTNVAVEGSCTFKLLNSDEWVLMYDCYNDGYYEYCTSTDLETFTYKCKSANIANYFTPRHGTTIWITSQEKERLLSKWPVNQ